MAPSNILSKKLTNLNCMKKSLLTAALCAVIFTVNAQRASVERSTNGIQTGLLGIWVHRELKLTNQIALRGEVGLHAGFWESGFYNSKGYVLAPTIIVEPRWYYNLDKRVSKSRNISGNSGNYLSLETQYSPSWFVISNAKNISPIDQISMIPTWGIRRNIGRHLNYETGIGIGLGYTFYKGEGYAENELETVLNLHLRIGYRF